MDEKELLQQRLINALQSLLILGGMVVLFALVGWLLGGAEVMLWTAGVGLFVLLLGPRFSPALMLRLEGARPLTSADAPQLHALLRKLGRRAGLEHTAELFYVPSAMPNAFSLGSPREPVVVVTDGLLRRLSPRELTGALAHEVSHIAHNDVWLMGLADQVSRMTAILSLLGQLLVLLNLPLILLGRASISWFAIALLVFAPNISALLQMALSRRREFRADLGAVSLTGDPEGLASALVKLEGEQVGLAARLMLPHRRNPAPSILRSHPDTEERIRRLLALTPDGTSPLPPLGPIEPPRRYGAVSRRPRHRLGGLWH